MKRFLAAVLHVSFQRCLIPALWTLAFALILVLVPQVGDILLNQGIYDQQNVTSPHNLSALTNLGSTWAAITFLSLCAWYAARQLITIGKDPTAFGNNAQPTLQAHLDIVRTWAPRIIGLIPLAAWYFSVTRLSNILDAAILNVLPIYPVVVFLSAAYSSLMPNATPVHYGRLIWITAALMLVMIGWAYWHDATGLFPLLPALHKEVLQGLDIYLIAVSVVSLVAGLYIARAPSLSPWLSWVINIAFLLFAASALMFATRPSFSPSLFSVAVVPLVTAWFFLIVTTNRREFLRRIAAVPFVRQHWKAARRPITSPHEVVTGIPPWTAIIGLSFLGLFIVLVIAGNVINLAPIPIGRALGSIGAVAIAVAIAIIFASTFQLLLERTVFAPIAAGIALLLPIATAVFWPHEAEPVLRPLVSSATPMSATDRPPFRSFDDYVQQWESSRRLGPNEPIFVVAAAGGGLRAALHTALTLAWLDNRTKGEFGRHVLIVSGVSGGSLGIAAWWEARSKHSRVWGESLDSDEVAWQSEVHQMLSKDYLAPAVASYVLHDVWSWGAPRRGEILRATWFDGLAVDKRDTTLSTPLGDLRQTADGLTAPILIFNSTRLPVASPVYFSNYPLGALRWIKRPEAAESGSIDVLSAVLQSARFPMVSPSGADATGVNPSARYVDGGYVENSGAEVILQLLANARKETVQRIVPIVIESVPPDPDTIGRPGKPARPSGETSESDAMTALKAVLTVRDSRASDAETSLLELGQTNRGFLMKMDYLAPECNSDMPRHDQVGEMALKIDIARSLGTPPLGWVLSDRSTYAIGSLALNHANCVWKSLPALSPKTAGHRP